MTDDERLERSGSISDEQKTARRCDALLAQLGLTEAVRFSERYPDVTCWLAPDAFGQLFLRHPRGLDALEAALLELAGEPPHWAEQLASEWEERAEYCRKRAEQAYERRDSDLMESFYAQAEAATLHASQLRARAKGEKP